jgi:hypothetical protein
MFYQILHNQKHIITTYSGQAPIGHSADQVYKATYQKVIQRNKEYYKRYPEVCMLALFVELSISGEKILTRMVQDVDTVHSKISLKVLRRRFSD